MKEEIVTEISFTIAQQKQYILLLLPASNHVNIIRVSGQQARASLYKAIAELLVHQINSSNLDFVIKNLSRNSQQLIAHLTIAVYYTIRTSSRWFIQFLTSI